MMKGPALRLLTPERRPEYAIGKENPAVAGTRQVGWVVAARASIPVTLRRVGTSFHGCRVSVSNRAVRRPPGLPWRSNRLAVPRPEGRFAAGVSRVLLEAA